MLRGNPAVTAQPCLTIRLPSDPASLAHHGGNGSHVLTELAPYLVAVIDLSGVIKYVNSVITRVMGYLPAEVIGRPFLEFVQREDVVVKERANRAPG